MVIHRHDVPTWTVWMADRFPRSSDKRDWCCGNFQKGCAATTLSPKGCATDCIVNGESRTCQEIGGQLGFCASLMSQWNCNAWICHQRFSWRWSCMIFVWYLSCCIHFWGWPGRCSIPSVLSHPRSPKCIFSHDRSGSTGPASTSLEFTRTLVSSLTAPFRHLLVRTSYRIIRDIGMIKIDSKLTSKLTSKLKTTVTWWSGIWWWDDDLIPFYCQLPGGMRRLPLVFSPGSWMHRARCGTGSIRLSLGLALKIFKAGRIAFTKWGFDTLIWQQWWYKPHIWIGFRENST